MNSIKIELSITLDSEAVVDLLVRAIEKGTDKGVAKILQAMQHCPIHEAATSPVNDNEPTRVGEDGLPVEAKLVDVNAVAKMLGVSARMVRRLRDSGGIPKPVIIGRLVRWRLEAIEEWIQAGCPAVERRGVKRGKGR